MNQANAMRRCWAANQPAVGTFVYSRDPDNTEIVGRAGYDFVIIDMEHSPLGIIEATEHIRAADATGIAPLVRLPGPDHGLMGKLLDAGARGLFLPHFGVDEAASLSFARTFRYAPEGDRPSCTGVRAADFALGSYADYVKHANSDLIAIGMIEDAEVLPRLDELFAKAKLDAVMPGPGDLSTSMGLYGQATHPKVREAVMQVIEAARRAKMRVGMYLNTPEEAAHWAPLKLDFFVYLFDIKLMAQAYAGALKGIRAGLG